MPLVDRGAWRPRGIDDLEPNAWRALRSLQSTSVVAGPGAGKSEFLAQRAVYLLETGLCPAPRRVLAISFKSDAAANLAERVKKRCPPELAYRFVSLTFDAFTKGLVDRFLSCTPTNFRPTKPYDLAFPSRRELAQFLAQTLSSAPREWQEEIAGLSPTDFESRIVGDSRLPLTPSQPRSGVEYALARWWALLLPRGSRSRLSFVGLNRLAELLLRANPRVMRALRATYPFLFVDEFQDTTYAQFDFLRSAFGASTAVTAVGDPKQRIMTWAGARRDAFERFETDFGAARIPLLFNFRSSPDLVHIQHVVARAMDPEVPQAISRAARDVDGDVAQVWNSRTRDHEARHLGAWIARDMALRSRSPRDYALLVRQKADEYEAELAGTLATFGLRLRNESRALGRTTLQDLLADEVCHIALERRSGIRPRKVDHLRERSTLLRAA